MHLPKPACRSCCSQQSSSNSARQGLCLFGSKEANEVWTNHGGADRGKPPLYARRTVHNEQGCCNEQIYCTLPVRQCMEQGQCCVGRKGGKSRWDRSTRSKTERDGTDNTVLYYQARTTTSLVRCMLPGRTQKRASGASWPCLPSPPVRHAVPGETGPGPGPGVAIQATVRNERDNCGMCCTILCPVGPCAGSVKAKRIQGSICLGGGSCRSTTGLLVIAIEHDCIVTGLDGLGQVKPENRRLQYCTVLYCGQIARQRTKLGK